MKIRIQNLGVIKNADIDLKPLTIFVGPNNAGKTWLAYTLAGIFGEFGYKEYINVDMDTLLASYPLLHDAVERLLKNGSTSLDLTQFAKEYGTSYFTNVAQHAKTWMPQFMSTQRADFDNLDISLNSLAEKESSFYSNILTVNLELDVPNKENPLFSIRKNHGDNKLYAYTAVQTVFPGEAVVDEQEDKPLPLSLFRNLFVHWVFQLIHRSLYIKVDILPTERTTIITFPFGKRKVEEVTISNGSVPYQDKREIAMIEPVNSFLQMLAPTILENRIATKRRQRAIKNEPSIKEYTQLARILEKQILNGELSLPEPEATILGEARQADFDQREILFKPNKKVALDISVSSSMVKELSTLVLYLRYVAKANQLLVIDEPEMNLHPEAQVKMIEFLAMLVKAGLNILITTHSPYMLDHLANLIKAAQNENKESIRDKFYLKCTDAFIAKENVSVYLFNQGRVTNALDDDGVIQWNTFGDVSERISEIYYQL